MPATTRTRFTMPPDDAELGPLRDFLATLHTGDADADTLFAIAVTEIATNAIEAHRRAGVDEHIVVTIDTRTRSVTIIDFGTGLPIPHETPSPDPAATSGRGLIIARSICPGLRVDSSIRGTTVTLPYDENQHV